MNKLRIPESGTGYKAGVKKTKGPVIKLITRFKSSKRVIIGRTYIPIRNPKKEIPKIGIITRKPWKLKLFSNIIRTKIIGMNFKEKFIIIFINPLTIRASQGNWIFVKTDLLIWTWFNGAFNESTNNCQINVPEIT